MQLAHVLSKQLAATLAGFQSSKKPAGKVVSPVQLFQLSAKVVELDVSSKGKEVSAVQLTQQEAKLVPLDTSSKGKEVNAEQPRHA